MFAFVSKLLGLSKLSYWYQCPLFALILNYHNKKIRIYQIVRFNWVDKVFRLVFLTSEFSTSSFFQQTPSNYSAFYWNQTWKNIFCFSGHQKQSKVSTESFGRWEFLKVFVGLIWKTLENQIHFDLLKIYVNLKSFILTYRFSTNLSFAKLQSVTSNYETVALRFGVIVSR